MIFGVTGHRELNAEPGEVLSFARLIAARMVKEGCTELISGMALGWDIAITEAMADLNVPFIAALPFPQQDSIWRPEDQERYLRLLNRARTVWVAGKVPLYSFYLQRDKLIVQTCSRLWALNSGRPSGTNTTVLFASQIGCRVTDLWADWLAHQEETVA